MSVSHGGILYYVVKIPKSELDAMSPDSETGGRGTNGMTSPIIKVDRLVYVCVYSMFFKIKVPQSI